MRAALSVWIAAGLFFCGVRDASASGVASQVVHPNGPSVPVSGRFLAPGKAVYRSFSVVEGLLPGCTLELTPAFQAYLKAVAFQSAPQEYRGELLRVKAESGCHWKGQVDLNLVLDFELKKGQEPTTGGMLTIRFKIAESALESSCRQVAKRALKKKVGADVHQELISFSPFERGPNQVTIRTLSAPDDERLGVVPRYYYFLDLEVQDGRCNGKGTLGEQTVDEEGLDQVIDHGPI